MPLWDYSATGQYTGSSLMQKQNVGLLLHLRMKDGKFHHGLRS